MCAITEASAVITAPTLTTAGTHGDDRQRGMGSGGRAAVDGAMAAGILAKLAKAGISFDCALRIVNSALLVKSGDESLATLDVARVDLFSGKAEFCKAGAAVSYVVRKGKIHRVDLPSLPAGILTEISFAKETYQLQEGDRLLMISDGVLTEEDAWLEGELLTWRIRERRNSPKGLWN